VKLAIILAIAFALFSGSAGVTEPSPEGAWRQVISEQNKDYSQISHAMLKIQDAAYLGDSDVAVLQGKNGRPESWHWSHQPGATGLLRVSLKGGRLTVTQNGATIDPALIAKSVPIDKDVDIAGEPTQVGAGVQGWRLFIFNQQSLAAKNFGGVSYFPYDGAYRVMARYTADPKLPPHVFRTSRGTEKQFYHAGDATFLLRGKRVVLPFYAESNKADHIKDISAFFTDDLTGKGAYGAGRYVDVDHFGSYPPRQIVIDFNLAYNPNCARSPYFTCPVAVDDISVSVNAGERDPHAPP
jgi:hypothetical protein